MMQRSVEEGYSLMNLRQELAHAVDERDRLNERIDQLEGAITALERLESAPAGVDERRITGSSDVHDPDAVVLPRPDLTRKSLSDAVIEVLEYFGKEMDIQQVDANVRLFGYPFRTLNTRGSVGTTLSDLAADRRVERIARGRYRAIETPATDLEDLLEAHRVAIVRQIESLEATLPFVGLKYYRDQILPQVVGELEHHDLRDLMGLIVEAQLVEVYQVPNPNNPEFSTAAVRLSQAGGAELDAGAAS